MSTEIVEKYPHQMQMEYALIGWILNKPEVMHHVSYLKPEDFYSAPHARVFAAMLDLHGRGQDITPFTVNPLVDGDFSEVGGCIKYLAASTGETLLYPWPADIAKHIRSLSEKRRVVSACEQAISIASDDSTTVDDQIGLLTRVIDSIAEKPDEFDSCLKVSEAILSEMNSTVKPVSTGLSLLDTAMGGGLFYGKSYGIAARKKVGKTCMAATISSNLNDLGEKHVFFAGEMSPKEIHQRILARKANIYASAFTGDYGQSLDCQKRVAEVVRAMPRNILFKGCPGVTFSELRRMARIAVEKHKVKGMILDYLQLVRPDKATGNKADHLDEVAQWVADFSRKHNIWAIALCQINQEGNTRGGEGIRLAFDQVYEIHREDLAQPDTWVEMMETRYTPWMNIGSKEQPKMFMAEKGPHFAEYSR